MKACSNCGSDNYKVDRDWFGAYLITCRDCYDGAPDSFPVVGSGATVMDAAADWDEKQDERTAPVRP